MAARGRARTHVLLESHQGRSFLEEGAIKCNQIWTAPNPALANRGAPRNATGWACWNGDSSREASVKQTGGALATQRGAAGRMIWVHPAVKQAVKQE